MADGNLVAQKEELLAFTEACLVAAGAKKEHAAVHADLLIAADMRGVNSHGLNRLDMYVTELQSVDMTKGVEPVVLKEKGCTALVDGKGGLGGYVGAFSMRLAMKKAKEGGIGFVVATHSNHYGIAAYYSLMAAKEGLIGLSMTNSRRLVCPTRSAPPPAIGTNPIACTAPAAGGEPFCLDMATSTVPIGKVELFKRKGLNLPVGWGVDGTGAPCTDPARVLDDGGLAPLGGDEEHCGYKGYGLGMMVDVLTGVLSGGKFGVDLGGWRKAESQGPADLSHCFLAIDPEAFADDFPARMQHMVDQMHSLPREREDLPVLVAGDPEVARRKKQEAEGVLYNPKVVDALRKLSVDLKVPLPNFTPAK